MSVQEEQQEEKREDVLVEIDVEEEVQGLSELKGTINGLAQDMDIDDYTAPASGISHGHDPSKHDVRKRFDVRDEFVEKHFHYAPNDHAALWEMSARKREFIRADEKLFEGKKDSDSSTWSSIESAKGSAPVPDETHQTLKSL